MSEPIIYLAMAGAGVLALGIAAIALLKGWEGWLALKRLELAGRTPPAPTPAMERIELADLKERIRKLESIAACVDL